MQKLRFAMVGTRASGVARANAILARSDCEIVATSGPGPARGAMHYEDAAGLLGRADIDAVVYAGAASDSASVVCDALARGYHVYVACTPGPRVEDMIAMRSAESHSGGKVLQFSLPLHFHGAVSTAKSLAHGGALGELLNLRAVFSTIHAPGTGGRGGVLGDKGLAMLDLMQSFCGPFADMTAMVDQRQWGAPGHDDDAMALMRNHGGVMASLHASATWQRETFRLELGFTDGYLWLDGILGAAGAEGPETLVVGRARRLGDGSPRANPEEEITQFSATEPLALEIADFVHAVRGRGTPQVGTSAQAFDAVNAVARLYAADPTWAPDTAEDNAQAAE